MIAARASTSKSLLRQATVSQRSLSSISQRYQQASNRPTVESAPSDDAQSRMADQSSAFNTDSTSKSPSNTHFGFRDVLEDDKIGLGKSICMKHLNTKHQSLIF